MRIREDFDLALIGSTKLLVYIGWRRGEGRHKGGKVSFPVGHLRGGGVKGAPPLLDPSGLISFHHLAF